MKRMTTSCLSLVCLFLSSYALAQNPTSGQILPSATPCDNVVESFVTDPAARGFSYSGFSYIGPQTSGEALRAVCSPVSDYVVTTPLYQLATSSSVRTGFNLTTGTGSNDYFRSGNTLSMTVQVENAAGTIIASYSNTLSAANTYCIEMFDADFMAGIQVRYRFIFTSSASTSFNPTLTFDNFTTASSQQIILPVTFTSFTATKYATSNLLTWKVTGELNVNRYEVERSSNGKSWVTYASVPAALLTTYTYTDAAPMTGSNYYRIKSVDIDGKYKYSAIVAIKSSTKSTTALRAFPSPASTTIVIEHDTFEDGTALQISSIDGRLLKSVRPAKGAQQTTLDVSRFTPGMYFIQYTNTLGEKETYKFIKQ